MQRCMGRHTGAGAVRLHPEQGRGDRSPGCRIGGVGGSRTTHALRGRGVSVVLAILLALAALLVSATAASAFSARGSVEQVDVTGLPAGAEMSLLRSNGETVA